jgi:6-pyruvoyl-tetrahydropterin synthase
VRIGRRYRFVAEHHVSGLPEPWCSPHPHDYTVEVVFEGSPPLGVNHEALDAKWETLRQIVEGADLNDVYGATTVEALAAEWRWFFDADEVTVWEDDNRWATATR